MGLLEVLGRRSEDMELEGLGSGRGKRGRERGGRGGVTWSSSATGRRVTKSPTGSLDHNKHVFNRPFTHIVVFSD